MTKIEVNDEKKKELPTKLRILVNEPSKSN
jgi:hypothetical protein